MIENTQENMELQILRLVSAIDLCLSKKFITPSLILIYSTIDIMAWLDQHEGHEDVQRDDFIRWADKYILPDSGLSSTAIDLYAARCSLLHSNTAESALTRKGDATRIMYAWGNAREEDLEGVIEFVGTYPARAIHVEKLFAALKAGIERFLLHIENDPTRDAVVRARAAKFFINMDAPLSQ